MKKILTLTAIVILLTSCAATKKSQYPKKYGKGCMSQYFIGY